MLILIIVIAFIIGVFFLIACISLGGFVYNGVKKNSDLQKKCLKILIPSGIIWFLLVMTNAILIGVYFYNNKVEILDLFSQLIQLLRK
ncbi:MAG: hypothetical protein LBV17_01765 [Treponema sp.]|jgi:hypothetical protein|nr:hypothetical protein [Treponema sp.]